ncbi:GDP-mannose 4,6-dehydratase [Paenibacillus brevis]
MIMRALITGIKGFVGRHLAQLLLDKGYEVWGFTRMEAQDSVINNCNLVKVDYSNEQLLINLFNDIRPDEIYHLAGQSSVKFSWSNHLDTFEGNALNTLRFLESLRKSSICKEVRVLTIGSSEEYGGVGYSDLPISESVALNPISPYGVSKASVWLMAKQYSQAHGMRIVHARPFNHIGPGQGQGFVTTDFATQIVRIEKGEVDPIISVGNLEAKRDFSDVRDIAYAYTLLQRKGMPGQAYNVCSGIPVSINTLLQTMIQLSKCTSICVEKDMSRLRPSDIPVYYGDPSNISRTTGWQNKITLNESLNDILEFWRKKL